MGILSLLQWIFLTQELNQGLLHCRWIFYQLSYEGSPYCLRRGGNEGHEDLNEVLGKTPILFH